MNILRIVKMTKERQDAILKEFGQDAELNQDNSITIRTDLDHNYIFLKAFHAGIEHGLQCGTKITER